MDTLNMPDTTHETPAPDAPSVVDSPNFAPHAPPSNNGDDGARDLALLALAFRFVDAHERIAIALERVASIVPHCTDDRQRWMYRLADRAVAEHPKRPEKVSDPRSRAAILATGLGESFCYWSMTDEERKAHDAAREAAKLADAIDNAAPINPGSDY